MADLTTTPWTTPADLRAQLLRRWDKGELLAERVALSTLAGLFPLRLVLRVPTSRDLSERFDEVRAWVGQLQAAPGWRLVMRQVAHRVIGPNSLPDEAWVDTLDDAVKLAGKGRELRAFDALLCATRQQQPSLLPWLQRQPLRALALAECWQQVLALVAWLQDHPRPAVYLRQVDLPGIHSKFIEAQRGLLTELFDLALPTDAIDAQASGAAQFNRRYGFLDKPLRLRFRWLCPQPEGWGSAGDGDYTVSQATFAALAPKVARVFITENEINFLAFPPLPESLVVFGAGYGVEALGRVPWLHDCALYYWGDIDTHGFAILDQLRTHFPHALSLLMDRPTLLAHRPQWTPEPQPVLRDLPRLRADEQALYDDLRWRRIGNSPVRLEQERLGYGWVWAAVRGLGVG